MPLWFIYKRAQHTPWLYMLYVLCRPCLTRERVVRFARSVRLRVVGNKRSLVWNAEGFAGGFAGVEPWRIRWCGTFWRLGVYSGASRGEIGSVTRVDGRGEERVEGLVDFRLISSRQSRSAAAIAGVGAGVGGAAPSRRTASPALSVAGMDPWSRPAIQLGLDVKIGADGGRARPLAAFSLLF